MRNNSKMYRKNIISLFWNTFVVFIIFQWLNNISASTISSDKEEVEKIESNKKAKESIQEGVKKYKQKQYREAIRRLYQKAIEKNFKEGI